MSFLSTFSSVTTGVNALSNVILVTPNQVVGYKPQDVVGQVFNRPSLIFNYEGEQTAELDSDITDHYVESNSAIQDQIALKPVTITTQGFIGELTDIIPESLQILKTTVNKLLPLTAYLPEITQTALIAYTEAQFLYASAGQAIDAGVAAYNTINGNEGINALTGQSTPLVGQSNGNQTKQQRMFNTFYLYWTQRTLFTVQTPWAIFRDMAIKNLRAIQDAETRMVTDFEVTFKQIRYANTLVQNTLINSQNSTGRNSNALSKKVNNGNVTANTSSVDQRAILSKLGGF